MQRTKFGRRSFLMAGACAGAFAATKPGATPTAPKAASAMRIRLLGTGTPTPSLKRAGAGYLVEVGERKVLFDFGPGAYHRLLQADVKPTQITDLFITHLHYDHWLDYIRLLITRWDQGAGRIPELNVYGPSYIARMTSCWSERTESSSATSRRARNCAPARMYTWPVAAHCRAAGRRPWCAK